MSIHYEHINLIRELPGSVTDQEKKPFAPTGVKQQIAHYQIYEKFNTLQ